MKNFFLSWFIAAAALAGMASCAQIKKPAPQVKAAAVGSRFDQVGWVTLYAGEPCTPQIMFDFHGPRSSVWLGAPMWETKILTEQRTKTSACIFWENGDVAQNRTVATLKLRARR